MFSSSFSSPFSSSIKNPFGGDISEPVDVERVLSTAGAGNEDMVSIWLVNSSAKIIKWSDGVTTNVPISAVPVEYTHTYTGETPNISLDSETGVNFIGTDFTENFTITTTNINGFTELTEFLSIGEEVIAGSVASINISGLTSVSFGDQIDNSLLTGDLGTFISNHSLESLNLIGGNTTYSTQTYSGNLLSTSNIYLGELGWSTAEVDQFFIDVEADQAPDTITVLDDTESIPSSSSLTERNSLISSGTEISIGVPLITDVTYSNTGQSFANLAAITAMSPSITPAESSNDYFDTYNLVTGLSLNGTSGDITGTPNDSGDAHEVVVRYMPSGEVYTGFIDEIITVDLSVYVSPTLSNVSGTATGETTADISVDTNKDIGTLYWAIRTTGTPLTEVQIAAGTGATQFGTVSVSSTGTQTVNLTGLTTDTEYFADFYYDDGTETSGVSSTTGFTPTAGAVTTTYKIAFGPAANNVTETGVTWNNMNGYTNDSTFDNLSDVDGGASTIDMLVVNGNAFIGINGNGHSSGSEYPSNATLGYFYSDNTRDGVIVFSGLNDSKLYDFKITSSRDSTATDRVGLFDIDGSSAVIDAANTPSQDTISDLTPVSGELTLTVSPNTGSNFAYLNVIEITEKDS